MPVLRGVTLQVFARCSLGCGAKEAKGSKVRREAAGGAVKASSHSRIIEPGPELRMCATSHLFRAHNTSSIEETDDK